VAEAVGQTPALAVGAPVVIAGSGTAGFSGDGGAATSAKLNRPNGVATDAFGDVYIFDSNNLRIREVYANGTINTVAGNGSTCSSSNLHNYWETDGNSVCNANSFALATTAGGQALFTNGGWLDEIYTGGRMAHIAGAVNGSYNPNDGSSFGVSVQPFSLVADTNGGTYFAENSVGNVYPAYSLKYLDSSGNVTTVAGQTGNRTCNGTYANNNDPAIGACIHPDDLAINGHYLYFYDNYHGFRIFKIDLSLAPTSRKLILVAGNGTTSCSGNGGPATSAGLCNETEMAFDAAGDLYVVGGGDTNIRWINTSGTIDLLTNAFNGQNIDGMASDGYSLYVSTYSNQVWKVPGLQSSSSGKGLVALGDSVPAGEGINYGFAWNGSGWTQTGPNSPTWADTSAALGYNYQDCHQSGRSYVNDFAPKYAVYNMTCTSGTALVEPGSPGGQANTDGGVMVHQAFQNGDATFYPQLGSSASLICTGCDAANSRFDINLKANSTSVVLLQIGADDVDFGDWMQRCYTSLTDTCSLSNPDQTTLDGMLTKEKADLRTTLTELNSRASADGYSSTNKLKVAVVGYYNPFGSDWNSSCIDVGNGTRWPALDKAEWDFVTHGLNELNTNISGEVTYAQTNFGNLNPIFVDLSSVMSGHEFCTSEPWVYGPSIDYPAWANLGPANFPAPFHPTPDGQYAIYQAIAQQAGL
jgi:hypothetical protein